MKIVIDIPDFTITDLKKKQNRTEVDNAVLSGTPLPKVFDEIREDIERWCAPYTYYNHKVIDKKEVFDIIDRHIKRAEVE